MTASRHLDSVVSINKLRLMYPEARCFVEYLTAMRPDLCDLSLHMSTSSSHQGLADSLPSITSTYEQPLLTPNVVPGAVSFEQQYQNSRGEWLATSHSDCCIIAFVFGMVIVRYLQPRCSSRVS